MSRDFLMSMPCSIFFMDTDLTMLDCNERSANIHGMTPTELKGENLNRLLNQSTITQLKKNHSIVTQQKTAHFFEEYAEDKSGFLGLYLSIKFPLFSSDQKIMGIYGLGIKLASPELSNINNLVKMLPFVSSLNSSPNQLKKILGSSEVNGIYLSKQETLCLHYTIEGKTAKEVALIIGLSYRTVESYLAHIKVKLNCRTKSELIDCALSGGFYFKKTEEE